MRAKTYQPLVLVVFGLLLALPASVAIARQTPTPTAQQTAFTECGPEIKIEGSTKPISQGMRLTGGCVTFESNLQQYTITARYVITAGTTLDDAQEGSNDLAQIGQTTIAVEQGELTVTVTNMCIPISEGACGFPGVAFVGKRLANGDVDWSAVDEGIPQTLGVGDMIYLQDVIATFTASSEEDTVISTSGVFTVGGGQGCPTNCFHMP